MIWPPEIHAARRRLTGWLLTQAFPIWWSQGADLVAGGFHDRLGADGEPRPGPRRCRIPARQVFAYSAAADLGWPGPWSEAMDHGLAFLRRVHLRPDGLYRAVAGADDVDLYDQAFVLLACASAARKGRQGALEIARSLFTRLSPESGGGFSSLDGASPAANPNMHLFEAFQALDGVDPDGPWRECAAGQARLAAMMLVDPETGAISEDFAVGWAPPPRARRRVEPGHQFEWAWLLMRWSLSVGDAPALAVALRLIELGENCGVDEDVVINALDGGLEPVDRGTRLWPQTERLRAALLAGEITGDAAFAAMAASALRGLERFLDVPTPGLWRDSLDRDDLSAPASSLYHLVGAVLQMCEIAPV